MIDFRKADVGLEVSDPRHGNGKIFKITTRPDDPYCIKCEFESGGYIYYDKMGRFFRGDVWASLCVGHDTAKLNQGELHYKPKKLEFDGTPKWGYVSNVCDYIDGIKRDKRYVLAVYDGFYIAIDDGEDTLKNDNCIVKWKYAWEIEGE